jgi:hypothetical protein
MTTPPDTTNSQLVGVSGDSESIVVMFPKAQMSKAEAIRHAAWLAVLADPMGDEFAAVLKAVRST